MSSPQYCDLHLHSDHSDGNFSAVYLPRLAAKHGIAAIALTDHDTVSGLKACAKACSQVGVEFIPGIEMSCSMNGTEVHVLGYHINPASGGLRLLTGAIAEHRRAMIAELDRRMDLAGWHVDAADYIRPNRDFVERIHVSQAVTKRYGVTPEEIAAAVNPYSRDLARFFTTDPAEVVAAIRQAGGVAVLAHPWVYRDEAGNDLLPAVVERCADAGLDGLELNDGKVEAEPASALRQFAAARGLIVTGGSDFHGRSAGYTSGPRPWTRARFPHSLVGVLLDRVERGRGVV